MVTIPSDPSTSAAKSQESYTKSLACLKIVDPDVYHFHGDRETRIIFIKARVIDRMVAGTYIMLLAPVNDEFIAIALLSAWIQQKSTDIPRVTECDLGLQEALSLLFIRPSKVLDTSGVLPRDHRVTLNVTLGELQSVTSIDPVSNAQGIERMAHEHQAVIGSLSKRSDGKTTVYVSSGRILEWSGDASILSKDHAV